MYATIGTEVVLTPCMRDVVEAGARHRYDAIRGMGKADRKQDKARTGWEVHLEGYAGELAFAAMFNVFPDFSPVLEKGTPLPDSDVTVAGVGIDVKCTAKPAGKMNVVGWKAHARCDAFALVVGDFAAGKYRLAGFITPAEVVAEKYFQAWGTPPFYAVPQGDLYEFAALRGRLVASKKGAA